MPSSQQHRDKANRNRAFLNSLNVAAFPDWAAVAAFYVAVHLVERLRTRLPAPARQHSTDHRDRLTFVHSHHPAIRDAYRDLFEAGYVARYETIRRFQTLFLAAYTQNVLVNQHLVLIEQYVAALFAPPPPPAAAGS